MSFSASALAAILAKYRTRFGSTPSDAVVESYLNESLARAEAIARTRLFDDGSVIARTMWCEGSTIHLDDAPVNAIRFFAVDDEEAFRVSYSGSGVGLIEVDETKVTLRTRAPGNSVTETDITLSDGVDVSDVVSSINGVADWSATTLNDGRADTLIRMPVQRARTETSVDRWVAADDEYRLDRRAGILHLDTLIIDRGWSNRSAGQVHVRYEAGFTALPADLEAVILNAARAGVDAASQTSNLQSEGLGDYSYTLAQGSSASNAVERAIQEQAVTIRRYQRVLP